MAYRRITEEFGDEGSVPYRSLRIIHDISPTKLGKYLSFAIKAINIASPVRAELLQKADVELVKDILGQESHYNIQHKLEQLRTDSSPSIKAKLMQRTLGLLAVEMVDAFSMQRVNPLVFYNDLHIPAPEIMPEIRKAGAVEFISLKIYQDGERRVRFHMFLDENLKQEFPGLQNIIHEHYGDSVSLVLAGTIHNQHYKVGETNDPSPTDYAYSVVPKFSVQANPEEAARSPKLIKKFKPVSLKQLSNRYYSPGDYYQMAGVFDPNAPYPYSETDKMTFHRGQNIGITATIFTQKYPEGERADIRDLTILPAGRPDEILENYESREVPKHRGLEIVRMFDAAIRHQLADINQVSTMLERDPSKVQAYMTRKLQYGQPRSTPASYQMA